MSGFTPRILLITGGAGFIGSHIVRNVLQAHQETKVINLDAHLDTRTDKLKHSGSPFRQISEKINIDAKKASPE